MTKRHHENAPGDWYIDTRCTDCSAARTVAPGLIVERGGQSVFARQPKTKAEKTMAWRARLLCPTASVRTETPAETPLGIFPEKMTDDVYRLGYNAASSYGAHSFLIKNKSGLIKNKGGNAMVDSPRWARAAVKALEDAGGLSFVLLTHRDDVADAARYAAHFRARVFVHKDDRAAAPFATDIVEGHAPVPIGENLLAIPVPGHTKGSVAYLYGGDRLFTGDSLAWSFEDGDLTAWRDYCWYSWEEQRASLARLLAYPIAWVFAGHGGSHGLPAAEMHRRLERLVERMKSDA